MEEIGFDLSVVVVSDYWGGDARSWEDLRQCVTALESQVADKNVEVILCEDRRFEADFPHDLVPRAPWLRVCFVDSSESVVMKNEGVKRASAPLVAILDGDCAPGPGWVEALIETFAQRPEVSVISGRTIYPNRTLTERILGLLSRAYLDPGHAGRTRFIANNNMAFRREVYLEHPLPSGHGPFVAEMQAHSLLRSGHVLWYEPRMLVVHEFDGWPMEVDLRKNSGFGLIVSRLHDRRLPFARLIRLGTAAIPAIVVGRTLKGWSDTLRCWRIFGLRAREVPASLVFSAVVHLMEVPGMLAAYRGATTEDSAYR